MTNISFVKVNKTMTFMKPELRLFLSDIYTRRDPQSIRQKGGRWVPGTYISFVDIYDSKWNDEMYEKFFTENFITENKGTEEDPIYEGYDVIECRSDQLDLVLDLCIFMDVYPEALIVHLALHSELEGIKSSPRIKLPANRVSFFIVKGTKLGLGSELELELPAPGEGKDYRNLLIYHPGTRVSFYLEGEDDPLDGTGQQFISSEYHRLPWDVDLFAVTKNDETINGRFREIGAPAVSFPDVRIAHFGISGTPDPGKAVYVISDGEVRVGDMEFASIITSEQGAFKVATLDGSKGGKFLIVHGRPTTFNIDVRKMLHRMQVFFPDMSQSEIDSIWKNQNMFIGNDRIYSSSLNVIPDIKTQYYRDGLTFAHLVMNPVHPKEARKIPGLSYIDNYLNTLVHKKPNGFFEYMISEFGTEVSSREDVEDILSIRPFTRTLLNVFQDSIRRESKLITERRAFLLQRIDLLTKSAGPSVPYPSERAVGNPRLEEEEKFRKKAKLTSYDPLTQTRKYYHLPTATNSITQDVRLWHKIIDQDYIVIKGDDYACVLNNCGFVILLGTGKVKIYGTIHSLVVLGKIEVLLNNVSPNPFNPETYLYIENGSVFDTIINYRDNLSIAEIQELERQATDAEYEFPRNSGFTPEPQRSVIKNLYHHRNALPKNYRTAMIDNYIQLH